jgi:hypothetical protein
MKTHRSYLTASCAATSLTTWILLAILFCAASCATRNYDPLAGWQLDFERNQVIEIDINNYIKQLPSQERENAGVSEAHKDGTGQHAIVIDVPLNGRWRRHVLIYDKNNKRIKVIDYYHGGYRS